MQVALYPLDCRNIRGPASPHAGSLKGTGPASATLLPRRRQAQERGNSQNSYKEILGRAGVLDEFEYGLRLGSGAPVLLTIFTGTRGIGKTVMIGPPTTSPANTAGS